MDKVTLEKALALLEECLWNGDEDSRSLCAWFEYVVSLAERQATEETIRQTELN